MRRGSAKGRLNTEDEENDGWRQYQHIERERERAHLMYDKKAPNVYKIHDIKYSFIQLWLLQGLINEFTKWDLFTD